ncbi:hypothetical protein FAM09_00490 [Niastella caeni]|uniref:Uncharacterized protein n=1 Tax=Niastella caeni TaxID=2569763 RepID=A0A4S8HY34_9BACT|nr:hypothetical protein [Niastella caeni]THU40627.1 hypothetical protein FAM09_00490 [Niastella caeni]
MKKATVTLFLLAFVIMLTTPFAVTPDLKPKPISTQVNYYWFDVTNTWLGRQNTVANEIALTGLDESTTNPKTLHEKGWAPANISFDQWGTPYPITSIQDKSLYSHP